MKNIYLVFALITCYQISVAQTTVNIQPVNTAYKTGYATASARTDGSMLVLSDGAGATSKRGYSVFDLSGIPAGSTIISAGLRLNYTSNNNNTNSAWGLYGYAGDLSTVSIASTLFSACVTGSNMDASASITGSTTSNTITRTFNAAGLTFLSSYCGTIVSVGMDISSGNTGLTFTFSGRAAGTTLTAPQLTIVYCAAPTSVTATATPTNVCPGATLTLTGGSSGATKYSWNGPGGFTNTNQSTSTASPSTGVYTFSASNICGSYTTTVTQYTSGVAVMSVPGTSASSVNATSVTSTGATIGWTNGNGNGRLVIVRLTSSSPVAPTNGTLYTANAVYGSGGTTGAGNYVVYANTGSSIGVTGLTPSTNYIATVYEYNSATGCINYASGASVSFSSLCSGTPPAAIGGTNNICMPAAVTLSDATTGGTWSSASTSIATISTGGVVTGGTAGFTTITYTTGSCYVVYPITVGPFPITGTTNLCASIAGLNMTESWEAGVPNVQGSAVDGWNCIGTATNCAYFSQVSTGTSPTVSAAENGTYFLQWNSFSAAANATATLYSPAFNMTGRSSGVVTLWVYREYNSSYTGASYATEGFTFYANTTNAVGGTTLGFVPRDQTTATSGGYISGTSTVSSATAAQWYQYTLQIPASFNGAATVYFLIKAVSKFGDNCYLDNIVFSSTGTPYTSTLSCSPASGTWTSANSGIATVNSSGIVTSVAPATVTISYTSPSSCVSTTPFIVYGAPGAISGTASVYVGCTTPLSNSSTGGTWSSTNSSIASVDPVTGVVSGASAGTCNISYSTGCGTDVGITVTVNSIPAIVNTGSSSICAGTGTTTLTNADAGGAWSTSDATIATVDASGDVSAQSVPGTVTITYTPTCGNYVTLAITVVTAPAAISGVSGMCVSSTTTLTDAVTGGTWSISGTATGTTIGAANGAVLSSGTTGTETVVYTLGSCTTNFTLSVGNTSPAAITGTATVCVASTTALADITPGGAWSSSDVTKATVSATGVVTGISNGTATITYNSGCGTPAYSVKAVTVNGTALSLGSSSACIGSNLTLTSNAGTGTYSWTGPNGFSSTSLNPVISSPTVYTSGTYSFTTTSSVGSCVNSATELVEIGAAPTSITFTPSSPSVCLGNGINVTTNATIGLTTILTESWENGVPTVPGTAVDGWNCIGTNSSYFSRVSAGTSPTVSAAEHGTNFLEWNSFSAATGVNATLYSPAFSMTGKTNGQVTFWVYRDYGSSYTGATYATEGFTFYVNTSPVAGGTTLGFVPRDAQTATTGSYISGSSTTGSPGWYPYTCTFPASFNGTATVYFLIKAVSKFGDNCFLDNIVVSATPSVVNYAWTGVSGATGLSCASCTTPTITPTVAGANIYSVSVTAGACSSSNTVTVNATAIPSITGTTPNSVCDGGTVALGATASAGTVNWYGASSGGSSLGTGISFTTPVLSSTTTYYVDATTGGCTTASRTAVTATVLPTPSITGTTPASRCDAGTVTLGAASSSGTIHWYAGSSGGSALGAGISFTTPTISTTTTYYVDASNGTCTTASRTSVTATVNNTPTITGTTPNYRCTTGTLTLGAASSAGTVNWYTASTGGSSVSTGTSFTTPSISVTTPYYVDATFAGCTTASRSLVNATISPLPSLTGTTSTTPVCSGRSITLTAGTPANVTAYSWAGPETISNSTLSSATVGTVTGSGLETYTVTVYNGLGAGCVASYTTTTTVNTSPSSLSASASSNPICAGADLSLTSSVSGGSGLSYSWTGPNGFTSTLTNPTVTTIPTAGAGIYSLSVTASGCNPSNTATSAVTVNTTPTSVTANASPNPICVGSNLSLTSTVTGGTGLSYVWSGPNSYNNTTANTIVTSINTVNAGIYSLSVTAAGCAPVGNTTSSVVVNVGVSSLSASVSSNPICAGADLSLTSSVSGGSGLSYSWTGPNGFASTLTNPTVTTIPTAGAGIYSLSVTASGCNPSNTATSAITVNTAPTSVTVSATPNPVCNGGNLSLTSAVTGGTGLGYVWSGPNSFTDTNSNAIITGVSTLGAGVYSLTVTPAGCSSNTYYTANVAVNNSVTSLVANASPSVICAGFPLTLTGSSSGGSAVSYIWTGPGGYSSTDLNPAVITSTAGNSGTYTLTANPSGCTGMSATTTVSVSATPAVTSFNLSRSGTVCLGVSETLSVSTSGGSGTPSFTWSGPGITGTVSTGSNSTYTVVPTPGVLASYTVSVVYPDSGCSAATGVSASVTAVHQAWKINNANPDWNIDSNWTCGHAPVVTDSVFIPAFGITSPEIMSGAVSVFSLSIDSAAVLKIDLGATLHLANNLANSGTIQGAGYTIFNGSSSQLITGAGTMSNVEILNNNGVTIDSSVANDTATLTGTLKLVAGTFYTNGRLVLSISDSQQVINGRLDSIMTGNINGKVIMQQYIEGGRRANRYWGHPFNDTIPLSQIETTCDISGPYGSTRGFTSTGSNIASAFYYNPLVGNVSISSGSGDPGWRQFSWCTATPGLTRANDTNLVRRFEGFRMLVRGAKGQGLGGGSYPISGVTIRQWGPVNRGSFDVPLKKGSLYSTTSTYGWLQDYNLISNPYPSAINIGAVIHQAFIDSQLNGPVFAVWYPYGGSAGVYININTNVTPNYYIPANSAVYIRAHSNGSIVHFSESCKVLSNAGFANVLKPGTDAVALNVYDANNHLWDLFTLRFNEQATDDYDANFEGGKPVNDNLNFFSRSADHRALSWDERPYESGKVIPLAFISDVYQEFKIRVDNIAVPAGGQLYLHDKFLEKYVLLDKGTEYSFTVTKDEATQGENRFELGTGSPESMVISNKRLKVMMLPNPATNGVNITFNAPSKEQTSVRILTVEGVCVLTQDLGVQQAGSVTLPLETLSSGIYMVEFRSGSDRIVQRLVKE